MRASTVGATGGPAISDSAYENGEAASRFRAGVFDRVGVAIPDHLRILFISGDPDQRSVEEDLSELDVHRLRKSFGAGELGAAVRQAPDGINV